MSPYTWKPLIKSTHFHDHRACDSSLLHACQLGSEISFSDFGANLRNIVSVKISTYMVYFCVILMVHLYIIML